MTKQDWIEYYMKIHGYDYTRVEELAKIKMEEVNK